MKVVPLRYIQLPFWRRQYIAQFGEEGIKHHLKQVLEIVSIISQFTENYNEYNIRVNKLWMN